MKNRIKVLFRILLKDKVFSFITIGGLAISLSISLLLAAYIFNEYSYDNEIPNIENIYRLCVDKGIVSVDGKWKTEFEDKYPEIEYVSRYDNYANDIIVNKEPTSIKHIVRTDKEFFNIFSVGFLFGDSNDPLPSNNSIAISSSLAETLFGVENPLGKTINIAHQKDFIISSVFNDFKAKSSVQAQVAIKWENVYDMGGESRSGVYHSRLFLMLNKDVNVGLLEEKLTKDYKEYHYAKRDFKLLPHKKSYMSTFTTGRRANSLHADLNSILLFGLVTALILIISVLNFIILFISNHISRFKEIGLKKTIGAGRQEIFKQFLFEAIAVSFIAAVIAGFMAIIFEPLFVHLIQKEIPVSFIFRFPFLLYIITGVFVVGFIAGLYPATIVSQFNPISIFQSNSKINRLRIKSGLSIIQYSISIVLIVSVIVMVRQNSLIKNKDVGFSKEQLICIKTNWQMKDKIPVIKEQLLANPYITDCSSSHGIPGKLHLWSMWGEARSKYDYQGNIPHLTVDPDFFKVYDVTFLHGRNFEQHDWHRSVIMNEAAFKLTGWETIDGKFLKEVVKHNRNEEKQNDQLKVVGVVKDFNVEKLNNSVAPTIIECSDNFGVSYLTCKTLPGDYPKVIADIKKVWKNTCPEYTFEYHFYDSWFDSQYKTEQHATYVTRIFAILAIIISCMGTFGIIHFISKQRTKEIGIRKTNGARIIDIIKILNWNFLKWILVAFIISLPASYFIMTMYLRNFAYKTSLSWWIFALAGLLASGIALLTVSWQSWRAATRNPVEALRYE